MRRLSLLLLLAAIALPACNLTATQSSAPAEFAANLRLNASERASIPRPTAPAPGAVPAPATAFKTDADLLCPATESDRPARQISADVSVDYAAKTARVDQRISFDNRERAALSELVVDVQTNQWDGAFTLQSLLVNDAEASFNLEANQLRLQLPTPLLPGCALDLRLKFHLNAEPIRDGLRAYRGFFGYSPRQLNLAHFLPTVAARVDGDWRIHQPSGIGEQVVHDLADWHVALSVTNAPADLGLAAPGTVEAHEDHSWNITLESARDFAISLGNGFEPHIAVSSSGVEVAIFAFDDGQASTAIAAQRALAETLKALAFFERRYGPYPRDRFVVVQGDFPDGMEFSGLVFVGSAWFAAFDGTHKNYLTLVSVHELAHQWFYAHVGSDSALHPWLDESLATYSEYLFFEAAYPEDRSWWWSFRVAPYQPKGAVDSDVYGFSTMRGYINTIYLRGAQMLHNLREDLGDDAFFALLRAYLKAGADKINQPRDFWGLLSPEAAALTLETRREFLNDPAVDALFDAASPVEE